MKMEERATLLKMRTINLGGQGELQEDGTITGANPFGIDNKEYQDLVASLPSTKGAPGLPPGVEPKVMENLLA